MSFAWIGKAFHAQPDKVVSIDSQLQWRPMLRADLDAVVQIEQDIFPFPWSRANFVDSLRADYDARLFFINGTLIGYALLMWAPGEVHLLNISVARAFQRQGFGKRLLFWLFDQAKAVPDTEQMLLEVRPSNVVALMVYEQVGFQRVGERKNYYPAHNGTRELAIVMRRALEKIN